ncbi:MAG TPA: carboxypeptidase regulatory-like domain-containing protein, partial [Saprospiraceae bacterium]|nr:carboxypeptidase regulatory-like domain-containing protein [Saprospiraceae bacterium]
MRKILILHILVISITSSLFAQKQDSIQGVIIFNENNINTSYLEFSPSFYEDGIVYISTQDVEKAQKKNDTRINKITMSIFEAKRDASGRLTNPMPFSKELTSKYHEGPLTFNHTGDIVFFTRSNLDGKKAKKSKDGITHLRIYSADKVGNTWKNIQDMPFNSDDFDCVHPTISADGNKMYFASDRPGTLGGMDIWVVIKSGTAWGEPVNLGPGINSKGNDAFPYIHPDGTLYYASDGRGGAGGYDMFYTTETGETWSEAKVMPYPFNAAGDDFGLIVDQESKNGYFTSNRSLGRGEDDIYSFNANANLKDLLNNNGAKKHNETLTINVADKITGEAIEGASVSVLNLDELTLANVFSMLDEQGKLIQVQSEANNPNDLVLNVDVDANGETALTDQEGKHVFNVGKGSFIAKVSKKGYKTKQVEIPESAHVKETLVLLEKGENTTRFNGMVIDEKLNAPIAGAKVTIQEEGSDKVETLYSNKAGKFEYDMQKGKNYIVTTEKNGVKETKKVSVPAEGDNELTVAFNGINSDYDGKGFVEGAVIRLPNIYYNFNDA